MFLILAAMEILFSGYTIAGLTEDALTCSSGSILTLTLLKERLFVSILSFSLRVSSTMAKR